MKKQRRGPNRYNMLQDGKKRKKVSTQLTENVSATFLFGCMGVWLEPNVA